MKTSDLQGAALDWAVAKCESLFLGEDLFGLKPIVAAPVFTQRFKPSTDWSQGGPIIEREIDQLTRYRGVADVAWEAVAQGNSDCTASGPTPLIAAMRCFVLSRLGSDVDVPEELLG